MVWLTHYTRRRRVRLSASAHSASAHHSCATAIVSACNVDAFPASAIVSRGVTLDMPYPKVLRITVKGVNNFYIPLCYRQHLQQRA